MRFTALGAISRTLDGRPGDVLRRVPDAPEGASACTPPLAVDAARELIGSVSSPEGGGVGRRQMSGDPEGRQVAVLVAVAAVAVAAAVAAAVAVVVVAAVVVVMMGADPPEGRGAEDRLAFDHREQRPLWMPPPRSAATKRQDGSRLSIEFD
ncbi:hypothetical protein ACFV0T_27180 [Streptomyces sp. NPDC059582]|uniref:hypothetical protein n=1 Tax=Streptomyces sp. NPDC059582 TaxID=3346875 RepID=UPI003686BEEC